MLEVENLVKRYHQNIVLDHINFTVEDGEIFGLLGPSGSGKSTAIQCIMSLLRYDKGNIHIFGVKMHEDALDIKRNIGAVMQDIAIFEELTVYENVSYFANLYLRDKSLVDTYTKEVLKKMNLLSCSNYYPKKLSEGILRRLNIACGIVHRPKLLILDEPTTELDPQNRKLLIQELKKLNEEGTTILISTHSMEDAEELCKRIAIINEGKIIAQGTKEELKNMISLSEKITMEVYELSEMQLQEIREITNIYSVEYKDNILEIKSTRGKNNLLKVMTYLNERNITIGKIFTQLPTLNDVFLELTGNEIAK